MNLLHLLRAVPAPAATPSTTSPPVTLAERLGLTSRAIPATAMLSAAPRLGKAAVGPSEDLDRIIALPRRPLDPTDPSAALRWTRKLTRGDVKCDCAAKYGSCIKDLLPIQGWCLEDAASESGELALVGVGAGKTGVTVLLPLVVPNCKVALLLIPPNLRSQFFHRDYPQWSEHFRVPTLGSTEVAPNGPYPHLYVVAYSELSSAKSTDLLRRIKPDLIVADEGHSIRRRDAARTKRFLRYFSDHPGTRLVALSGTLTTKSLKDYGHLADLALKERSPLPRHYSALEEWASALDAETADTVAAPIGELRRLCDVGEEAREGFRRRLVATRGVVATAAGSLGTSLVLDQRNPPVPQVVRDHLTGVRASWTRPDGEELTDAISKYAVLRQLAAGFYYRWTWPRHESVAVIEAWLAARKNWHREVRDKLHTAREFQDSPLLLANAAIRWFEGFTEDGVEYPPHTRHRLTWASKHWEAWLAVRDTAEPATESVWVSDYLVQDAAAWAQENIGLLWYEHSAFGAAVAAASGAPLYGPGAEASLGILKERGDRSIVVSIKAHGQGKNLQMWNRNLVMNPPSDGAVWEQLLGRTHRQGQLADTVEATVYRHTPEMQEALDKATERSRYIQGTTGTQQKLLYASRTW